MNNFSLFDEIVLVYANNKGYNNGIRRNSINYVVVVDIDNIVENIDLLKKIVASLEISKTIYNAQNVDFNYSIVTKEQMIRELNDKSSKTAKKLRKASIIYNKNNAYEKLTNKSR